MTANGTSGSERAAPQVVALRYECAVCGAAMTGPNAAQMAAAHRCQGA